MPRPAHPRPQVCSECIADEKPKGESNRGNAAQWIVQNPRLSTYYVQSNMHISYPSIPLIFDGLESLERCRWSFGSMTPTQRLSRYWTLWRMLELTSRGKLAFSFDLIHFLIMFIYVLFIYFVLVLQIIRPWQLLHWPLELEALVQRMASLIPAKGLRPPSAWPSPATARGCRLDSGVPQPHGQVSKWPWSQEPRVACVEDMI